MVSNNCQIEVLFKWSAKSSVNRKRGAITYFQHVRFQSALKIHKRPFFPKRLPFYSETTQVSTEAVYTFPQANLLVS